MTLSSALQTNGGGGGRESHEDRQTEDGVGDEATGVRCRGGGEGVVRE